MTDIKDQASKATADARAAIENAPSLRNGLIALLLLVAGALLGAWFFGSAVLGVGVAAGVVIAFCVLRALPFVQGPRGKAFWVAVRENGWPIVVAVLALIVVAFVRAL